MFEIYIPFYNSPFCAEYQAKTLRAFMRDEDVTLIFVDNNMGYHPEASLRIIEICKEYDIELIVNNDPLCAKFQEGIEQGHVSTSDKLGHTLNLIYGVVLQRKPDYFGFLDQDCFAFKPVQLKEYLDEHGAYGKVVPTHPDESHVTRSGEHVWNLHVMCNFFKRDFLSNMNVNFMPGSWCERLGYGYDVMLDTGGVNWWTMYKDMDRSQYVLPEEHFLYYDDISLLDPNGDSPTKTLYEVLDNKWVHMVHAANSGVGADYLQPKTSYMKGFLDFALLSEGACGAAPRPESDFVPTYRDPSRHFSFDGS